MTKTYQVTARATDSAGLFDTWRGPITIYGGDMVFDFYITKPTGRLIKLRSFNEIDTPIFNKPFPGILLAAYPDVMISEIPGSSQLTRSYDEYETFEFMTYTGDFASSQTISPQRIGNTIYIPNSNGIVICPAVGPALGEFRACPRGEPDGLCVFKGRIYISYSPINSSDTTTQIFRALDNDLSGWELVHEAAPGISSGDLACSETEIGLGATDVSSRWFVIRSEDGNAWSDSTVLSGSFLNNPTISYTKSQWVFVGRRLFDDTSVYLAPSIALLGSQPPTMVPVGSPRHITSGGDQIIIYTFGEVYAYTDGGDWTTRSDGQIYSVIAVEVD